MENSAKMHVQRRNIWWSKLAFHALLSHAEQTIFQIILKKH